jgi:DNA repair protein RecN (Recombination protein N)
LAGEGAASDALATVVRSLDDAATLDSAVQELASRATGLAAEVSELARDARSYAESLSADPERLQAIRERRQTLKALQRKYGETDADVVSFLAGASERLASLTGADERLETLRTEVDQLRGRARDQATRLHDTRAAAAARLASAIRDELRELGMPEADVGVELEPVEALGPTGADRAELVFSGGPGQSLLPLAKVASGGELSRTMLACRSVMADLDDVPTLVFDEVDAGIGGQAGFAVGRRLAALAASRQVLVVSHLPQIACFADRHIRVEKRAGVASVAVLDDGERVRELSRMLAGLPESERALSHAEELLEAAAHARA